MFAILLPTKFPIASPGDWEKAAFKDTRNSGKEVPNATTVRPTTS